MGGLRIPTRRARIWWQLFFRKVRRAINLHRVLRQGSDLHRRVRCEHNSQNHYSVYQGVLLVFVASCCENGIGNVVRDLLALDLSPCYIWLGCVFCMGRGLVQREGMAQWQPALETGQDHALMARSALQSRWLGHVHVCGAYFPQTIPYNEFREAPGITCAADLSYQGEVGGRL